MESIKLILALIIFLNISCNHISSKNKHVKTIFSENKIKSGQPSLIFNNSNNFTLNKQKNTKSSICLDSKDTFIKESELVNFSNNLKKKFNLSSSADLLTNKKLFYDFLDLITPNLNDNKKKTILDAYNKKGVNLYDFTLNIFRHNNIIHKNLFVIKIKFFTNMTRIDILLCNIYNYLSYYYENIQQYNEAKKFLTIDFYNCNYFIQNNSINKSLVLYRNGITYAKERNEKASNLCFNKLINESDLEIFKALGYTSLANINTLNFNYLGAIKNHMMAEKVHILFYDNLRAYNYSQKLLLEISIAGYLSLIVIFFLFLFTLYKKIKKKNGKSRYQHLKCQKINIAQ